MGLRAGKVSVLIYKERRHPLLCDDTARKCNAHGPIATFCWLEHRCGLRCVDGNWCVIALFFSFVVAFPLLMEHSAHSTAPSIARRPTLAFVSPRPMVLVVVRLFGISKTKAVTLKDGQNRESGKAWNFRHSS
jgi:hypothetical protein